MKRYSKLFLTFLLVFIILSFSVIAAEAPQGVKVTVGPTDIVNGVTLHEKDITVSNEFYKVGFGVGTLPPWGVPHGSIIDTAIFVDGKWTDNRTALIDFLPNGWAAWPSTYQIVEVVENTPQKAVITIKRDYDDKVDLVTTYTVEAGSKILKVTTEMVNNGETAYETLISGYSLCTLGGYMFGPWGETRPGYDQVGEDWFGDIVLGYDENWTIALHNPGFTDFAFGTGWRDLYNKHSINPGESMTFDAWVQFEDKGSSSEVLEANLGLKGESVGTIKGTVKTIAGSNIEKPVIIVEKLAPTGKEMLYVWDIGADGQYEFKLAPGSYKVHAAAKGYSLSEKKTITITEGKVTTVNFDDIQKGGTVVFEVKEKNSGEPMDARIEVTSGPEILVGFVGAKTFFTSLADIGKAEFILAPGDYKLTLSQGGGFTAKDKVVEVTVQPETTHKLSEVIERLVDLPLAGWYSADLHHHSDILDGVTPPEYLVRSQLASGLDIIFVSDHDSIANNKKIGELAGSRDVPYISSIEVSPNWGHINVMPIALDGTDVYINPRGTVSEIFAKARELGALIMINHPYITYGYFHSNDLGMVPGGWDADFDVIEINAAIRARDNHKALQTTWDFWNKGDAYYLVGASDVHDVWLHRSGNARTIAHVDGDFTLEKYYAALKQGNSYATYGPLVYPEKSFGSSVSVDKGESFDFAFKAVSVNGLKKVTVVTEGSKIDRDGKIEGFAVQKEFTGNMEENITVSLSPEKNTWYALVIEDEKGKLAMTNPVWVNVVDPDVIQVLLNGKALVFDVPPVMENSRVLVPFRAIGEAVGAEVDWDGATQTVTLIMEGKEVKLVLGSTTAWINGVATTLDVPAKTMSARTLVPIRFVSKALGAEVDWEPQLHKVIITH